MEEIPLVDAITELAMEVNGSDIDWGLLSVDEEGAYRMMALSTIENKDLDNPIISRSVITALLVENFVLNMKILQSLQKGGDLCQKGTNIR